MKSYVYEENGNFFIVDKDGCTHETYVHKDGTIISEQRDREQLLMADAIDDEPYYIEHELANTYGY